MSGAMERLCGPKAGRSLKFAIRSAGRTIAAGIKGGITAGIAVSGIAVAGMGGGSGARAEPLSVVGIQAQAFSFSYRNVCWVIFPDHITPRGSFNVVTATPSRIGRVDVLPYMRFPELDLALGQLFGAAAAECGPRLGTLAPEAYLPGGEEATLTTVRESGELERVPVRLTVEEYAHLGLSPVDPALSGRLGQGRSGSMVMAGGRPVAMMTDIPADAAGYGAEIRALRMDAALSWLARYLNRRGPVVAGAVQSLAVDGREIGYEVVSWSALPVEESADPRSLAQDGAGPYLIAPQALPAVLEIEVAAQDMPAGSEAIILQAAPAAGMTVPRRVDVYARRAPGTPFRFMASGTIDRTGIGRIAVNGQRFEALQIRILEGWDPGVPVRLDRLKILVK